MTQDNLRFECRMCFCIPREMAQINCTWSITFNKFTKAKKNNNYKCTTWNGLFDCTNSKLTLYVLYCIHFEYIKFYTFYTVNIKIYNQQSNWLSWRKFYANRPFAGTFNSFSQDQMNAAAAIDEWRDREARAKSDNNTIKTNAVTWNRTQNVIWLQNSISYRYIDRNVYRMDQIT